jgi:hypothetical protein
LTEDSDADVFSYGEGEDTITITITDYNPYEGDVKATDCEKLLKSDDMLICLTSSFFGPVEFCNRLL